MDTDYIQSPPASLPPGCEVVAYLRDSGGPNQSESIGQQERVIIDYCKKNGLALSKIYSETASGRKTKNRNQFIEMVNTLMTCPDDIRPRGLILWAYSRFSRDISDFNFYLYGLLRKGLIVHSLTEQIPEGLAGQIFLSLKAYTNADFSIQLGKQIKRGIADRVTAGYSNGGQAPKGYRVVRDQIGVRRNGSQRTGVKWERDPELAPLVSMAWEMRAQGKSYGEITKATGGKLYTNKNSWPTHFKNKSYLGIGKAGDLEIPDHHEPLITWELWEAVRKIEKAMPRYGVQGNPIHPRRLSHPSLLSSLAFCIHCGAAMVLHTSKDYRNYICGKRDRKKGFTDCPKARCVNTRKADKVILDTVLNKILSPSFVEDLLDDIQSQMVDTDTIDREIGEANNLLVLTERSITRLLQLAESAGEIEEIAERLKKLKQEKADHSARIKALKAEREAETPQITPEALALVFSEMRAQIQNAYQSGDLLIAKKLIAHFVSKIELGHDAAIIHYTYPVSIPADDRGLMCAHLKSPLTR
jgi:DNA invertase Pin-like site-specific DNA recombinase